MPSDLLGKVALFSKLSVEDREGLTNLMRAGEFPAQQTIFWIGERGDKFYVVQSGKVSVSCLDESGTEVILAQFGPGQFFGEIALLDEGPRTATARASVDSTLLTLERHDFLQFLEQHPKAAVEMLIELGRRLRETDEKIRGIKNVNQAIAENSTRWQNVAERIANFTATQWFVMANILFCAFWVVANLVLSQVKDKAFDKPPEFSVLGIIITVEALFISLFVLFSQAQQNVRDRIRADLDYQVNLKAHQEVMQLHKKVDLLQTAIRLPSQENGPIQKAAN